MKTPSIFTKNDVLRANEAMQRRPQVISAASAGDVCKIGATTVSSRLSSEEINRAFAEARKALEEV
ncbi:hypothetical protein [Azonexus sp.]|jgi:hypothetical protein|uniref:hypothetical protein n=1 Tax=Azonexus sp. TaxID=1872668 RepID=UPI0039E29CEE